MPRRALAGFAGAIVVAVALSFTAAADAAKLCVNHAGCSGPGTNFTTIQAALSQAGTGSTPDTILVGPGTYHGPFTDDSGNPVTLVGSGNATVLDLPGNGDGRITLTVNDSHSSFSSFAVAVPAGASGSSATGNLGISGSGTLDRVKVSDGAGIPGSVGISSYGLVDRATVTMSGPDTRGVTTNNGRVRRSRISASSVGVDASAWMGSGVVENSLIKLTSGGSLHAAISVGSVATAHQVTLIGPGDSDSQGIRVAPFSIGFTANASADVDGAVIQRFGHALGSYGYSETCYDPGSFTPTPCDKYSDITVSYSNFDPTHDIGSSSPPNKITMGPGNLNVDPGFRNPFGSDYTLRRTSKIIDKGDPDAPLSGDATTDLAGGPRKVDGDHNGSAVVDMGAFEFPPSFGSRTLVQLDRGAKKAPGSGPLPVVVSNLNGFLVTGTLAGETANKIPSGHHKKRRIALKSKTFSVGGHRKVTVLLDLPKKVSDYFKDKGKLTVDLLARVRAPAGDIRNIRKSISVTLK